MSELVTSVASASKHGFVHYDGVHQVADRLRVGTAVLHCPSERFPVTEPVRCTMTPEGCRAVPLDSPRTASRSTTRSDALSASRAASSEQAAAAVAGG
jgi:hypothetical protein